MKQRLFNITEDSWNDEEFVKLWPKSYQVTDLARILLSEKDLAIYEKARSVYANSVYTECWYRVSVAIFATLYNWKDKHE